MNHKKALITGITGQDGSYPAELLLDKGYEVHGIKRRASSFNTDRIDHIYQDPHVDNSRFKLHYGDLSDGSNLTRIMQEVQPDEVYILGAQSHLAVSFEIPEFTADVDGMVTLRLFEAIRPLGLEQKNASTKPPLVGCMVWCRKSPARNHALLPTQPPCGGKSVGLLDYSEMTANTNKEYALQATPAWRASPMCAPCRRRQTGSRAQPHSLANS